MPTDPHRQRKPSPPAALLALAAAAVFAASLAPRPSRGAEAPKPVKKDSSPRTRPKDAVLTPSVSPAEARPGDTVVYKVSAKLSPGWHIYTYTNEAHDEGPRKTRFDLFDADGLAVVGGWTASREPIRKKEPAFPDIDSIAFFEDDVAWSLSLKIPADAAPGKKTLRCQASYQICNDKSCSFPGAWTLPDVALTVAGGPAPEAKADAPAPAPDAPQPKRKDGPGKKPKPATLTASLKPTEAKPGETVVYSVIAKLEPGWHIYDYAKRQPSEGPSNKTLFDLFDTSGLTPAGDWTASTAPQVKAEEAFNNAVVSYFENEVTWSLPLKVPSDAAPGRKAIRCQADYSVCNAKLCLPPYRGTLPEVVLTVLPAGAAVADAAPRDGAPAGEARPAPVAGKRGVSDVEAKAREGIIPLMIASALGGLFALLMPCVWPMVPITVNFFVKQGQAKSGSPTALAVTYCLAIVGLFTAIGVFCSFFVSATALPRLANNPWLNFAVAGLFFAFGLSLLGLFEIRLPNALLNASSRGESRGGLVGVVFMALTLTITSFTCTFPVVGGLLVMASSGQFFYPIIGLATFSAVIALPFFLLALSPGLLSKVPKSGDWMNAVKVVGGLVEIAAAFKFLNTAELAFVTPDDAWVNAPVILTAWVVLAAVCGFYLLGFFKTDHDHEDVKVGPGRMVLGSVFLGFALFLTPALFGRPPQNQIWSRLVIGLLPPDVSKLSGGGGGGGGSLAKDAHPEVYATSGDPDQAQREEKRFHGVWWGFSYEEAVEKAKAENKPILIDFTGVNCANCRLMEASVLPRPEVSKLLAEFIPVQLYTPPNVPIKSLTPAQREALSEKNAERQIKLGEPTNPFYVVLSPREDVIATTGGYVEPGEFAGFLKAALGKLNAGNAGRVARVETGR